MIGVDTEMKLRKCLRGGLRALRYAAVLRRPWVFALVAFIPMVLALVAQGILFASACESGLNPFAEFSDEQVVAVHYVELFFLEVAAALGLLAFLVPLIPCVFKRYGHAGKMLLYAFGMLVADIVVFGIIGILVLIPFDQVDIAMDNIERKKEAMRQGKTDYERRPLPKIRQHTWLYDNGRFEVSRDSDGSERCFLVDKKGNPDPDVKDRYWGAVMLDGVVQWKEAHGDLYLLTESGEKYVLNYMQESVCRYPDSRQCPQCDKSDAVFKELKERSAGCQRRCNEDFDKSGKKDVYVKRNKNGSK